ncbi:MAG TPA: Hint domain-containing protein, partial [Anaerolineales bacterium]|nr:Hint domain-containing protein [Anaerolineales bacterium]
MKSDDWDELEFDFKPMNVEFKTRSRSLVDRMIKTIAWQWEADSIAANSILPVLSPFITSSEAFAAWSAITTNECLTGDHEVLTPNGWKYICQIAPGDKIAQWDYETKEIDFVVPDEMIVKHHTGIIYHFHDISGNVSQVVTPNHRLPVVYPYYHGINSPQFRTAEEINFNGGNGLPNAGYLSRHGRRMSAQER